MGYALYITRPPHFDSRIRRRITPEAWEATVRDDATLIAMRDEEGAVTFTQDVGHPSAVLKFGNGNVLCKNPDEAAVAKLIQLADALGAIVQGEDGEIYFSATDVPYLVQFTLFERVSRRLRVRFPPELPTRPRLDLASMVMSPIVMNVGAHVPQAGNHGERPLVLGRLGRRMPIGFPAADRKPSAALQALLSPVRPALQH